MLQSSSPPPASFNAAAFWPTVIPGKGVVLSVHESPRSAETKSGIGFGPHMKLSAAPSFRWTMTG